MTAPWWTGLPPAQVTVDCNGQQHTVRWADGALHTPDHDDPDGERTLAALGGEPNGCIELLDAWSQHSHDLDVLLLASRGPSDPLQPADVADPRFMPMRYAAAPMSSQLRISTRTGGGRFGWVPSGPSGRPTEDQLTELLRLGVGLPHRLVATVTASWAARIGDTDPRVEAARPRLTAALHSRVTAAARAWLSDPDLHVVTMLLPPGASSSLTRTADTLTFSLPFSWLIDVWAKDLTTVAGRFCLDATSDTGGWVLHTVGSDGSAPPALTIRLGP